jgi:hypothetical protein
MKKILFALGVVAAMAFNSQAASYSVNGNWLGLVLPNSSEGGDFIVPAGVPSVGEEIVSAYATFILVDQSVLGLANETITVSLDGDFFASAQNFFVAGLTGGVNLSFLDDGVVEYKVASGAGNGVGTLLVSAVLNITTGPATQPVPDGGSMMALLGLSVLGLGWASRRVRA